ncbi:hypothetical protein [Idiomarina abyssalis]|uniref:Uncharacterized protein n=1 Tax=Idiomarina abyssalis TaxID=86102 RepID=A0A8I1GE85_9GAMM|nr:hypothetical protein [Idiomarina abyssalis]MBJ7265500.1 hypothetical protein [Idiomarina abyssalis]MBJ7316826.1 hypothetical protein [Idiomarina abyssalis]
MTATKSITWDGFDCNGILELLGHWDWGHKNGVLIVKNPNGIVFIPKGESLEVDSQGYAIAKIDKADVELSVTRSAKRLFEQ